MLLKQKVLHKIVTGFLLFYCSVSVSVINSSVNSKSLFLRHNLYRLFQHLPRHRSGHFAA